jgi:hypothetical protein
MDIETISYIETNKQKIRRKFNEMLYIVKSYLGLVLCAYCKKNSEDGGDICYKCFPKN